MYNRDLKHQKRKYNSKWNKSAESNTTSREDTIQEKGDDMLTSELINENKRMVQHNSLVDYSINNKTIKSTTTTTTTNNNNNNNNSSSSSNDRLVYFAIEGKWIKIGPGEF